MGVEARHISALLSTRLGQSCFPSDSSVCGSRIPYKRNRALDDCEDSAVSQSQGRKSIRRPSIKAFTGGILTCSGLLKTSSSSEVRVLNPGLSSPRIHGCNVCRNGDRNTRRYARHFDGPLGENWKGPEDQSDLGFEGFEMLDSSMTFSPSLFQDGVDKSWTRFETWSSEPQELRDRGYDWSSSSPGKLADAIILDEMRFWERCASPEAERVGRMDMGTTVTHVEGMDVARTASWKAGDDKQGNSVQVSSSSEVQGDEKGPSNISDISDLPKATVPLGLAVQVEGLSIPDSLRSLKKRNGRGGRLGAAERDSSAIKKAFDSMVFMIRTLQSHAIQIRQVLVSDNDIQGLLSLVHKEMLSSFVWLFQQVFSRTPTLMVSVMILLANFTVFSMGNNVAGAATPVTPSHSQMISVLQKKSRRQGPVSDDMCSVLHVEREPRPFPDPFLFSANLLCEFPSSEHGIGKYDGPGGNGGRVIIAGGEDGNHRFGRFSERNSMYSEKESRFDVSTGTSFPLGEGREETENHSTDAGASMSKSRKSKQMVQSGKVNSGPLEELSDERSLQSLLEETVRELELKSGETLRHAVLDQETIRRLIAPISAKIEADNYLCFDRTDLEYQHAIGAEPENPLLLSNYAQFLYAIRHDNNRAEDFFHRAMKADYEDVEIMARFASFLWLARKNRSGAEKAYRTAIASDPSNPFLLGGYAHFLWHAGDEEATPLLHIGPAFYNRSE